MAAVVTQVDLNITFIHTLPVLLCTVSSSVDSSCITFSYYKTEFPYLSPHLKLCVQELYVLFCLSPYRILCSAYYGSLAIIIKLKNFAGLCVVLCNKKIKHVAHFFKACYLTKSLHGALRSYYLLGGLEISLLPCDLKVCNLYHKSLLLVSALGYTAQYSDNIFFRYILILFFYLCLGHPSRLKF